MASHLRMHGRNILVLSGILIILGTVVYLTPKTSTNVHQSMQSGLFNTSTLTDIEIKPAPNDISVTFEHNYTAKHIVKDCNVKKVPYYSQSQEDEALFKTYFSSPIICNGIYVEIGALDGLTYTNTKFFEDGLGWSGVLIEGEPNNAIKLKKNRPKSIVIPEAVCPPGQNFVEFQGDKAIGGIPDQMTDRHKDRWIKGKRNKQVTVPCRPIGVILRDSGIKAVDFFILDVEGAELLVLETMDWDIPVKAFVIEMGRGERDRLLIDLLAKHGYKKANWNIRDFCKPHKDCTNNQVFEHPSYLY